MPNWCSNQLQVRGPSARLAALREHVADPLADPPSALSFAKFAPLRTVEEVAADPSSSLSALLQRIGGPVIEVDAWGTKWDVRDVAEPVASELPGGDTQLVYQMSTAWSPPEKAIATLASLYPDLTFVLTYSEPGNAAFGVEVFTNGEPIVSHELDGDPILVEQQPAGIPRRLAARTLREIAERAEADLAYNNSGTVLVAWQPFDAEVFAELPWWALCDPADCGSAGQLWFASLDPTVWVEWRILSAPETLNEVFAANVDSWEYSAAYDVTYALIANGTSITERSATEQDNLLAFLLAFGCDEAIGPAHRAAVLDLRPKATTEQLFSLVRTAYTSAQGLSCDRFVELYTAALADPAGE